MGRCSRCKIKLIPNWRYWLFPIIMNNEPAQQLNGKDFCRDCYVKQIKEGEIDNKPVPMMIGEK